MTKMLVVLESFIKLVIRLLLKIIMVNIVVSTNIIKVVKLIKQVIIKIFKAIRHIKLIILPIMAIEPKWYIIEEHIKLITQRIKAIKPKWYIIIIEVKHIILVISSIRGSRELELTRPTRPRVALILPPPKLTLIVHIKAIEQIIIAQMVVVHIVSKVHIIP